MANQEGFYEWTPPPGLLLIIRDSNPAGFISTVVVDPIEGEADPEDPFVDEIPEPNHFVAEGLPSLVRFSFSQNTWTVETTQRELISIFPIEVTYLIGDRGQETGMITRWDHLPASDEATQVLKLETKAPSPHTINFTVTASYLNPITNIHSFVETRAYQIRVIHSYTANKLALQEEVRQRKTR